jgi:hypothetical protein
MEAAYKVQNMLLIEDSIIHVAVFKEAAAIFKEDEVTSKEDEVIIKEAEVIFKVAEVIIKEAVAIFKEAELIFREDEVAVDLHSGAVVEDHSVVIYLLMYVEKILIETLFRSRFWSTIRELRSTTNDGRTSTIRSTTTWFWRSNDARYVGIPVRFFC